MLKIGYISYIALVTVIHVIWQGFSLFVQSQPNPTWYDKLTGPFGLLVGSLVAIGWLLKKIDSLTKKNDELHNREISSLKGQIEDLKRKNEVLEAKHKR